MNLYSIDNIKWKEKFNKAPVRIAFLKSMNKQVANLGHNSNYPHEAAKSCHQMRLSISLIVGMRTEWISQHTCIQGVRSL